MDGVSEPTRVAILGATGSIGTQALDVVRAHPDRLRVVALGANRNIDDLRRLAVEFPTARTALGPNALVALATDSDADLVLVATPGVAALSRRDGEHHRAHGAHARVRRQSGEHRGRKCDVRDSLRRHEADERIARQQQAARRKDQRRSAAERHHRLEHRRVEAERGELQDAVAVAHDPSERLRRD